MPSHTKEIRQLAFQIGDKSIYEVASRLEKINEADLRLLRKCLKLERMRRKGQEFVDV